MKKAILRNALKVLAVGGAAAGFGSVSIGLACLSVRVYCAIPATNGYAAVALFGLATLTAATALAVVYVCGCWIVRKGKFSK